MNFGQAIESAKEGKKIRRTGWVATPRPQYVVLASSIHYESQSGGTAKIDTGSTEPVFALVDRAGIRFSWIASQADMLAEDWETVE